MNIAELRKAAETLKRELPLTVSDTELVNADGLVRACVYGPYEACSDPVYANALALAANALTVSLLAECDRLKAALAPRSPKGQRRTPMSEPLTAERVRQIARGECPRPGESARMAGELLEAREVAEAVKWVEEHADDVWFHPGARWSVTIIAPSSGTQWGGTLPNAVAALREKVEGGAS